MMTGAGTGALNFLLQKNRTIKFFYMQKNIKTYIVACGILCSLFNFTTAHAQKNTGASGNYILSSINLEDKSMQDTLQNVPVFEDANINCLLNSEWQFSDGTGYYKIDKASACAKGMRQIAWKFFSLKGSSYFQFFRTAAVHGVPADEHNIYVCEVQSSAKQTFTLRYPILFADKPNAILFTFTQQ